MFGHFDVRPNRNLFGQWGRTFGRTFGRTPPPIDPHRLYTVHIYNTPINTCILSSHHVPRNFTIIHTCICIDPPLPTTPTFGRPPPKKKTPTDYTLPLLIPSCYLPIMYHESSTYFHACLCMPHTPHNSHPTPTFGGPPHRLFTVYTPPLLIPAFYLHIMYHDA